MDKDDFYEQTTHMLEEIGLQMTAYGIDSELTAHEATKLWMQLNKLTQRMGDIKNATQSRDWSDS